MSCSTRTEPEPMSEDALTTAKILVVDDEPANVRLLERLLATAGYRHVEGITDAREALGRYRAMQPDLVLLDLMMPHLDGIAVLASSRARRSRPWDRSSRASPTS